jgi:hypothetical protein
MPSSIAAKSQLSGKKMLTNRRVTFRIVCLLRTIDCLRFYVPLKNFSLLWRRHHCRWRAAKFRPMLVAQGLWAGRDLYRAIPAVTRDLGFSDLIRRTAPFSRLLRHTRSIKNCQCIFTLLLLSPLGEERSPSFEETWIPYLQGWFVPSLVKIGPVVLEKKIFKWHHPIITVLLLSPLWREPGPLFEEIWIPFTQG